MSLVMNRVGLAPEYVDYREALALQEEIHSSVSNEERDNTVLLLEHPPVYTAGKRTEKHEYPQDGTDVVPIDRGGKLTWHGPGMLIGYPIVKLPEPFDVVRYVRILEEILMKVVCDLGVKGERVEGRSGVWVRGEGIEPDRKIAAIGIRVAKKTTMHGFALNCNNDLSSFANFIPCGITDASVTTISEQLGRNISPSDVVDQVETELLANADRLAASFTPRVGPSKV
ncbi:MULTISPECIES: lipoyl(octanoyl) transferase LipB [Kocuria]|uniref:lipoyl(octanoyl) transferase LipB n=1 Tax=Kocuria TaxID=57493 RepID=UPI000661175D|nr:MULTISPECIES: lipoyl(octanoyl) transferase LipB [Kocuria]MCT1366637.1 lipoyl(octanoyl) transferase LipB [Rothia sp. p3-SID1597]RUQ22759.1 lipoyl(octanoyl) transferase LipB [Kocuria sp. HSID16901]